jgi:hypothetical protein
MLGAPGLRDEEFLGIALGLVLAAVNSDSSWSIFEAIRSEKRFCENDSRGETHRWGNSRPAGRLENPIEAATEYFQGDSERGGRL